MGLHVQAERRSHGENTVSLPTHRRGRRVSISRIRYRGTSRYQRREKGANDSRTWLELRKFRSTAAASSRKSKYRLRTRKSIPAWNIYRQRVTPIMRSFRRNNEVFHEKNWVARVQEFFSFHRPFHFQSILLSDCTDATAISGAPEPHRPKKYPTRVETNFAPTHCGVDLTSHERVRSGSLFEDDYTPLSVWMNEVAADEKDIYYSNKDTS